MPKRILTLNDVIELNHVLKSEGLQYKVHLHDACGSQSFTIEALGEEDRGNTDVLKDVIQKYFDHKGSLIRFTENILGFAVV